MTRVYLSLGSNMGDRQGYLQKAVKTLNDLPETEVKRYPLIMKRLPGD